MVEPNRRQALALGTTVAACMLMGADKPAAKSLLAKKTPPLKVEETIGDIAYVRSAGATRVEGVGLVVGLNGTGSDPEPGIYRDKLLAKMRAAMVPQAEQVLASKTTSLVVVRASIPVGVDKTDMFDVEVEATPASATSSLAGGVLLKTELIQVGYGKEGQPLDGKTMGYAYGPVVTATGEKPEDLKKGRILGGARVKQEIPYALIIKDERKSIRTAALVQSVVGGRFFRLDGVNQKGMAEAKTDQLLDLRVPRVYHQNQARYFQVLQLLPIVDTPELRIQRMQKWGQELLDPKTAGTAALKLEGIGRNATATLKTGLSSPYPNVRFFAAEALAYLNDASGVDVLSDAAINRPEFRAFALAALAATDQASAVARLRDMMSHPDIEVRYGAFNALRTLDEHDPFLGRTAVVELEVPELDEQQAGDEMAMRIAVSRALRSRPEDPFFLYLVDSDGPPLVHVSNSRRCEVVIFGKRQRLLPPLVLGNPNSVLVNASADDTVAQLTSIGAGPEGVDRRSTSALELGSVIREMVRMGANYPDVVEMLRAAERQHNLEGPLVVDALPAPSESYEKAQLAESALGGESARRDEAVGRASSESGAKRRGLLERLRPGSKKPR